MHLAVGRAVHRGLSKERSEKEGKERIGKKKEKEGETKKTLPKAQRTQGIEYFDSFNTFCSRSFNKL